MTNAYQLKPWTQVVTPHDDILEGNLDSSTYAASLGSVVRGDDTCPRVYRDAREFFKATYMTKELRSLLEGVLRGLNGEKGDRVLQLRTPFGGGKTHSLVSLYHLVENREKLQDFPELTTLPNPGKVKTVAFIGLDVGASTGVEIDGKRILTPWGYMAWKIGGAEAYALLETEDQLRIAPGNDVLRKVFGNDPVLLLLDEFLVYVESAMALPVGDSTFGRQVLTFIQKLTEVVRELPRAVLVYSLQASIQESFGNDGTLVMLDKLVSRIDAKKEPVAGDEVMKIIQRRLFADIGDTTIIEEVAYQQAELYRKFYESYEDTSRGKQQVQQQANLLAERIKLSYPFHPDLLDLMYYRWGSLPSYQRTRGALQFLARVVYALRNTQDTSLLITPANIPFQDEGVRGAFFSQVGERERFVSVIDADIVGRKAKVKAVDSRIAADSPALSLMKVGTRVASAILMYSFGAKSGQDRGVLEQEVTSACLARNLNRNIITATLSDLRDELLYLHHVGKRYRFETKPNLNKLIADEESKIAVDEVLDKIRDSLTKSLQNARGKVILWAKDSNAISDRISEFSIVYLSPEWAEKSREAVLEEALNWLEYRGNDKRDYKNALAFVIPSKPQIDKARKGARTVLAVSSLIEQKAKYKFAAEDIEELKTKIKDAKQQIEAALRRLYEYILLPLPDHNGTSPIRLELVDLQSQLNTSQNLQDRVLEALSNYLFESITPTKLIKYSGLENSETEYIKASELVSYFFRFPTFPITIPFTIPVFTQRRHCWQTHLQAANISLEARELELLSDRFRLTPDQIAEAVATAQNNTHWQFFQTNSVNNFSAHENEHPNLKPPPSIFSHLCHAARIQSSIDLGSLAYKIEPKYTWDDIILRPNQLKQLQDICKESEYRDLVHHQWGFADKLSLGKGLNVLFSGASGTGKTMAAEVIAHHLQLDLYKIDLSQIISKYIGETEKNLNRIFTAATNSNAILLFDEADALFGKRSEVTDARDRYANIEVGYLLQKMEEYEGITILTTNLRDNIDKAFERRLRFIVKFNLPDAQSRQVIWHKIFPQNAPRSSLDLKFLAQNFEITGASIRNIALTAAFLAADDAGAIDMNHIIKAIQREYQKSWFSHNLE